MNTQNDNIISKESSLILKGIGILLLLFHHLFYNESSTSLFYDYYIKINSHDIGIINQLGKYAKLCVAIFVFASGYGLETTNLNKNVNALTFYKYRYKKLYLNYWFIWVCFVPIGIFIFARTLTDAYGNYAFLKMFLDFFGLLNLIGEYGYNPTWWFYSCIILLYLLYPILHRYLSYKWLLIISIGVIIPRFGQISFLTPISNYLLPFIIGILVARIPISIFDKLRVRDIVITIFILSTTRNISTIKCIIDTLLCVSIAAFIYKVKLRYWIKIILVKLGKHSQNIFLFHTFIFLYWFREETYITRNPLIIFIQLTVVCYLISVAIEFIKQKIGFYKLCK